MHTLTYLPTQIIAMQRAKHEQYDCLSQMSFKVKYLALWKKPLSDVFACLELFLFPATVWAP